VLLVVTACGFNVAGTGPAGTTHVTGSGKVVMESREVSGFSGVIVNGAGKLYVDRTGAESISITTDDNLAQYIVTQVRGGKLVIEFKQGVSVDRVNDLTFRVSAKDFNSLEINGGAEADVKSLDTDQLTLVVNGAGAVKAAGRATQLTVTMSGTGAYTGEDLASQRASITNNGLGMAVVRVSDELNAEINGAGSIEYIGNPRVTKSVNGVGVVRQR
jgi:hypothetical protein